MLETTIFYEAPNVLAITQSPLARLVEVQHIASTVFSIAIENSRIHILYTICFPPLSFFYGFLSLQPLFSSTGSENIQTGHPAASAVTTGTGPQAEAAERAFYFML
jgi:hypothetical protein